MKLVKYATDKPELFIVPIGDIHYGHRNTNVEAMLKNLEYCLEVDNRPDTDCKIIGMGDWLEFATKDSPGSSVYEQTQTVEYQYDDILTLLEPFKHLFIGWLEGNHNARGRKAVGINVDKILAQTMNIPFMGYSGFFDLRVQNRSYSVFAWHGGGNARSAQTKIGQCMKQVFIGDADIYLMGHVHDIETTSSCHYQINRRNKSIEKRKRFFVLTGHFLEYENTYAEEKGFIPGKLGSPKIKLYGNKWDVHVSL